MLLLNKFFNHPQLVAFTTDSKTDYTLDEAVPFLSETQRAVLEQSVGASINRFAWVKQVHGAEVVVVDDHFLKDNGLKEADALVTKHKNVLVAVRTADCLPVFIWDPTHQAMGIVHAGWKSTQKEIVRKTYEVMAATYQSDYEDLLIAFGPAIRSCCYRVGDEFTKNFPNAVTLMEGKLYMDLIKANRDQLTTLGVERHQLFDCRMCTVCDQGHFSYRRDGDKAGRMISGFILKG